MRNAVSKKIIQPSELRRARYPTPTTCALAADGPPDRRIVIGAGSSSFL
jgi:hypothetical protein